MTVEKNKELSEQVYNVGNQDPQKTIKVDEDYYYNKDKEKLGEFRVLAVENNKNNGMQAMAVAPVDINGEVEILLKLNKQIKRV